MSRMFQVWVFLLASLFHLDRGYALAILAFWRPVQPRSPIESWSDWPKDVVGLLRTWNKQRRLSFPYLGAGFWPGDGIFVCTVCLKRTQTSFWGDAKLDGKPMCDQCLIDYARNYERIG